VEKGQYKTDDIDHLKNRRVRCSGHLIQTQFAIGLIRLEKMIRDKLVVSKKPQFLFSTKPLNGALREFFGTNPLSQFMDQMNPLAEITHKRRLSSMGPGGVTRDNATLAIRGIHPSHYGRICPIETPEGKNTGLVNSLTTYARINNQGLIESPFFKVYKGQIQKDLGMMYLTADEEEKTIVAAPDVLVNFEGFLPNHIIPAKIGKEFTTIKRNIANFIGVHPIQMISVATSLIPFLEHDDANRALMGSNMQRQAVPVIRPERPLVGTGVEVRAVSDSGHALIANKSGYILYVSGEKMVVY
jgi:DNA-directed RNA polymerase subunit beta